MTKELLKAIVDKFKASTDLFNSVSGEFYTGIAPQEDLEKYIVLYLTDITLDQEFDYSRRLEIARVQFSIFCKGSAVETISDIYEHLTTAYDRAVLSFSAGGWVCVEMNRDASTLIRDDEDYWHYAVSYIIVLQPA